MVKQFALIFAFSLYVPAAVEGTEIYAVTSLGSGPLGMASPKNVNDSGVVAGDNGGRIADYWQNGVVANLPSVSGYVEPWANDINSSGQIVGYTTSYTYQIPEGIVWQNGAVIAQYVAPANAYTQFYSINNQGQIAGTVGSNIYLWQLSSSGSQTLTPQSLGLPPGATYEEPYAINNKGQIVGSGSEPFLWQPGVGFQVLVGPDPSQEQIYGINDNGQIVGGGPDPGTIHAKMWLVGGGTISLGTLGGNSQNSSLAYGINNSGQVVGESYINGSGTASGAHAFIWQASTGMIDLNTMISPSSGWTLQVASGINNAGQIVGYGTGTGQGFLLTPPALSLSTSNSGAIDFGNVLVGTTASMTISASNTGPAGSSFGGGFSAANAPFSGAQISFGTLTGGASISNRYQVMPIGRGRTTQLITINSDLGNSALTLAATGVAPVISSSSAITNVRIGTTGLVPITVKNIGDGNLSSAGSSSNLNGTIAANNGIFIGSGASISLPDNSTQIVTYSYQATARRTSTAIISGQFSDGSADGTNSPQATNFTLVAQGVGPSFSSSTAPNSSLNFGTLTRGASGDLSLLLANSSSDSNGGNPLLTDLTLNSIAINGPDASKFELVGYSPDALLPEGANEGLEVLFLGSDVEGDYSAMLAVSTDETAALGGNGNTFSFPLNARVAPEPGTLELGIIAAIFLTQVLTWRTRRKRRLAASYSGPNVVDPTK